MGNGLHYFQGGNFFERTLRFLNLLEPGHMVLSLSKLAVYATLAGFLWAAYASPANLAPAIGALGAALGHYGYRRWQASQNAAAGVQAAPDRDDPVTSAPPPPVPADQQ